MPKVAGRWRCAWWRWQDEAAKKIRRNWKRIVLGAVAFGLLVARVIADG